MSDDHELRLLSDKVLRYYQKAGSQELQYCMSDPDFFFVESSGIFSLSKVLGVKKSLKASSTFLKTGPRLTALR